MSELNTFRYPEMTNRFSSDLHYSFNQQMLSVYESLMMVSKAEFPRHQLSLSYLWLTYLVAFSPLSSTMVSMSKRLPNYWIIGFFKITYYTIWFWKFITLDLNFCSCLLTKIFENNFKQNYGTLEVFLTPLQKIWQNVSNISL